jgi:hypothetical protein
MFFEDINNGYYNWIDLYNQTDPRPWPELNQVLRNYKRSFGEDNTCWGLFFQRNVDSILRKQRQIKIST